MRVFVTLSLAAEPLQEKSFVYDGSVSGRSVYAYVGNEPAGARDPSGMIKWEGQSSGLSFIIVVGAAIERYDLTSECIDGRQAEVTVIAVGPGKGIGASIFDSGASVDTTVSFTDNNKSIDPNVFNGVFVQYSAMGSYGPGKGGIEFTSLGHATDSGPEFAFGWGIGIDINVVFGSSTVTDVEYKNCSCKQK